jgi:prophage DNA circulation protein
MNNPDANEALPIVQSILDDLLWLVPVQGLAGSAARTTIGDTKTNAYAYLRADLILPPLDLCFQQVRESIALDLDKALPQFEQVRRNAQAKTAETVGGIMIRDNAIVLCLAAEAQIIAAMTFISREQVVRIRKASYPAFCYSEEAAADSMDQMGYQAIVSLHAAVTNHLVTTAFPLPRVLSYRFAHPFPSLVMAQKLYQDPSRADEMRDGNSVVHPAFMPVLGSALSK